MTSNRRLVHLCIHMMLLFGMYSATEQTFFRINGMSDSQQPDLASFPGGKICSPLEAEDNSGSAEEGEELLLFCSIAYSSCQIKPLSIPLHSGDQNMYSYQFGKEIETPPDEV